MTTNSQQKAVTLSTSSSYVEYYVPDVEDILFPTYILNGLNCHKIGCRILLLKLLAKRHQTTGKLAHSTSPSHHLGFHRCTQSTHQINHHKFEQSTSLPSTTIGPLAVIPTALLYPPTLSINLNHLRLLYHSSEPRNV